MAFGFLSDVGDIVQGAAGIASLFGDTKEPKASKQSSAALNEAIKLAKASANPESPEYKNLLALEEASLRDAAVRQITEFLRQNKRAIGRGDISGIVNPERRDESVMKALASAFQGAEAAARDRARASLSNAAGALTGAGTGLQPVANTQLSINQTNAKRQADLGQALGAGISSIGGVLDDWFGNTGKPAPGSTNITLG